MTRQGIIERVKIIMDEFTPVNQGVVHPLDAYIDPIIDDSVRTLYKEFPIDKLWHSSITASIAVEENSNLAKATIPKDVVRVSSVKLKNWNRAIHEKEFEMGDSVKLAWQGNPATRASSSRPLVIKKQMEDGISLDLYGLKTKGSEETAQIFGVKMCKPEELNEDLITPFTYLAAYLLATHIERVDIAKPIYEQYLKHLQ